MGHRIDSILSAQEIHEETICPISSLLPIDENHSMLRYQQDSNINKQSEIEHCFCKTKSSAHFEIYIATTRSLFFHDVGNLINVELNARQRSACKSPFGLLGSRK